MVMLSYYCPGSHDATTGVLRYRTNVRSVYITDVCAAVKSCCVILSDLWLLSTSCREAGDSLNDCRIIFVDDIYKIEEPGSVCPISARPLKREYCIFLVCIVVLSCDVLLIIFEHQNSKTLAAVTPLTICNASLHFLECCFFLLIGQSGPVCKACKDNPNKTCRICACHICGGKQDPDKQLMCDECDMAFHIYCLNPPLSSIPDDEDW